MNAKPDLAGFPKLARSLVVLTAWVAASLPFELRVPLLQLGPLSITNVEAVLYLALAAWAVRVVFTRRITFTAIHGAVMLMALALVLSALFAPTERAAAWKFTLRSLGGMALCFVVADVIRTPKQLRLIIGVLVSTALFSALAALAEAWWPDSRAFLAAFKTRTFNVGGFFRAGGTFEYPNTSAMFWEAVLPLGIVLAASMPRSRIFRLCIAAVLTAVFTQAIILSASRAALFGAALALVLLMGLAWRLVPALRVSAIAGGVAALLVVACNLIANPLMALRLQSETNDTWFRAEIYADQQPITLQAGETLTVSVRLHNTSIVAWQADGEQPVRLSYHWLDATTHKTVLLNGLRTNLPSDVPPDADITLAAQVMAPPQPGEYFLQWDVLQEHVAWFSTYRNPTVNVPVTVTPSTKLAVVATPLQPITRTLRAEPTRSQLWRAAWQMWVQHPVFGIGPDNFRHLYGPYLNLTLFNTAIHTNNWYIETLTNTGLLGAIALLVFMVVLARTMLRPVRWRTNPNPVQNLSAPPDRSALLLAGCGVALFTFFTHGLLDYFFEFTPTYGLFWLLVGLVECLRLVDNERDECAFNQHTQPTRCTAFSASDD